MDDIKICPKIFKNFPSISFAKKTKSSPKNTKRSPIFKIQLQKVRFFYGKKIVTLEENFEILGKILNFWGKF